MTVDTPTSSSQSATTPSRRPEVIATVTLAAVAFIVVTGETAPVGLLGDVARGVGASESQVGLTVSWYALVAAATAVPLTRWSAGLDRRLVLVFSAVVFGVGHVLAAVAPNLAVLAGGRCLAALGHGVYFAVAAPTAIRLASEATRNRAGSRVSVGAATAMVVGAPLATLLGQLAGWRTTLAVVAVVSLALAVAVARWLPPLPALHREQGRAASGVRATLGTPGLVAILLVTAVAVTGHFALYIYVAPYTAQRLDVSGTAFTVVLLGYGSAAVLGSVLGGRLADRSPVTGTRAAAGVFVTALLGLYLAGRLGLPAFGVPLLLIWGGSFSLLVVSTTLAVLRRAAGPRAETANALYGIVFQVGIVAGSALGAGWHSAGRTAALPLVAATVGAVGLILLARPRRRRAAG
ncbi:MFS transporter [Micromonospora echinofusca]|uniref:MFS transporter n=1 Tax=Micromonospora echinofusca TaxID=47858 RepID=A0ABS3VNZ5_MICEH|nr:MFS transporter [Micromonospora echinofusca]MBO4206216.1 MFS transporter [Micromonospora echinofusca]